MSKDAIIRWLTIGIIMIIFIIQGIFLINVVSRIEASDRAIGCELAIDPTQRTPATVNYCFIQNGQDPPTTVPGVRP